MRDDKQKEEMISPYNASGYLDLTPFYAVLSIIRKEKTEEQKAKAKNDNTAQ